MRASGSRNYLLFALLLVSTTIPAVDPSSIFWTAPSILVAALLIAWAAESAQFCGSAQEFDEVPNWRWFQKFAQSGQFDSSPVWSAMPVFAEGPH